MTTIIRSDKNSDLLRKATFEPVVNADGKIETIRQLEVPTDRSTGVAAMVRLSESHESNDSTIDSLGWTFKQRRILNTPAPLDCHILKASRKWDAALGEHKEQMILLLDYDVVWTLFERIFDGQYSVKVRHIEYDSEEIMPAGTTGGTGEQSNDAPGRIFYARAHVEITLHLQNGTNRVYEGVGVAYDQLKITQTGNVYSINSARRTAEKGAVSDAKREALGNIGRVFRRAFEDGSEMKAYLESQLLAMMAEHAKPKIHAQGEKVSARRRTQSAAPAPEAKKPEDEAEKPTAKVKKTVAKPAKTAKSAVNPTKETVKPAVKPAEKAKPGQKTSSSNEPAPQKPQEIDQDDTRSDEVEQGPTLHFSLSNDEHIPMGTSEFMETFLEFAMGCETEGDLDKLVELNASGLSIVDLNVQISEIRAEISAEESPTSGLELPDETAKVEADGIPDFDVEVKGKPVEVSDTAVEIDVEVIDVDGKSGKKVLGEFKQLFDTAKSEADLDRIVTKNKVASRKLTPKQLGSMVEARVARASQIKK